VVGLVKRGYAPSRMTSRLKQQNLRLWSARHMTVNSVVKSGTLKMLDVKMTDMKVTDQMTGHEIADIKEHDMKLAQERQTFEAE